MTNTHCQLNNPPDGHIHIVIEKNLLKETLAFQIEGSGRLTTGSMGEHAGLTNRSSPVTVLSVWVN